MPNLIIGIILLCGGLVVTTIGGFMANDGWEKLRSKNRLELLFKIDINRQKIMSLINKGAPLENIKIFFTKYTLKKDAFSKQKIEIEDYNKMGGAIKVVPSLRTKDSKKIDLTQFNFLSFYDDPGGDDGSAILTYYCFRIVYMNSDTKNEKIVYKTTGSYKNFPSPIEDTEHTAVAGMWGDFMHDIPKILGEHQKRIFNDNL